MLLLYVKKNENRQDLRCSLSKSVHEAQYQHAYCLAVGFQHDRHFRCMALMLFPMLHMMISRQSTLTGLADDFQDMKKHLANHPELREHAFESLRRKEEKSIQ